VKIYLVEHADNLQNHHISSDDYFIVYDPNTYCVLLKLGVAKANIIKAIDYINDGFHAKVSSTAIKVYKEVSVLVDSCNFKSLAARESILFHANFLINYLCYLDGIISAISHSFPDKTINKIDINSKKHDVCTKYSDITPIILKGLYYNCANFSISKFNIKVSRAINLINQLVPLLYAKEKILVISGRMRNFSSYIDNISSNDLSIKFFDIRYKRYSAFVELFYSLSAVLGKIFHRNKFVKKKLGSLTISSFVDSSNVIKISDNLFKVISSKVSTSGISDNILLDKIYNIVANADYIDNSLDMVQTCYSNFGKNTKVVGESSVNITAIMGEAAGVVGLESYLIPHGSSVPSTTWKDSAREQMLMSKSFYGSKCYNAAVVQSPQAELSVKGKKSQKNIYKSLPIAWGSTFINYSTVKEKIILYATSPSTIFTMRPLHYHLEFEFINEIYELIEVMKGFKDYKLYIKFRPSSGLSIDSLNKIVGDDLSANVEIVMDKNISYYLKKSSIMISNSSTALEEALYENIPVIQYSKKYKHISDNNDNVFFATNQNELKQHIRLCINSYGENERYNYIYPKSTGFFNPF